MIDLEKNYKPTLNGSRFYKTLIKYNSIQTMFVFKDFYQLETERETWAILDAHFLKLIKAKKILY